MCAYRWLAVLALALLLMGHAVDGKRRKAQARDVKEWTWTSTAVPPPAATR